jgi:hypothetical protein
MAAGPVANTIWLRGEGIVKEAQAGGTVTPGHLVVKASTGKYVVHPSAELNAYPCFAMEKDFVGKDITTTYVLNELIQVCIPQKGSDIYALLPANAIAVIVGDELVSNGDGTLKKVTAAAVAVNNIRRVVAVALEAIDNSAVGAVARIRVEVV